MSNLPIFIGAQDGSIVNLSHVTALTVRLNLGTPGYRIEAQFNYGSTDNDSGTFTLGIYDTKAKANQVLGWLMSTMQKYPQRMVHYMPEVNEEPL